MSKVQVKKMVAEDLQKVIELGGRTFMKKVLPHQVEIIEKARHYHSILIDGELHACMGVDPYWPGRADAWIVLNPKTKHSCVFTVRKEIIKLLDACPIRRIECSVARDENFEVSDKWATSLKFKMDHPRLKHFLQDGTDAALYSRIKENA
jgi:hypothetical protein